MKDDCTRPLYNAYLANCSNRIAVSMQNIGGVVMSPWDDGMALGHGKSSSALAARLQEVYYPTGVAGVSGLSTNWPKQNQFILGKNLHKRNLAEVQLSSLSWQRVLNTYEYEVVVNNDELYSPASAFILSFSFLRLSPLSGSARTHLSGFPRGDPSPGHPPGWPADTLPPDSCHRMVLRKEDTRLREGGMSMVARAGLGRNLRDPGFSEMIHLELLWRLIVSWFLCSDELFWLSVQQMVLLYEKLV